MNLLELLDKYPRQAQAGVPEWMLGAFRRASISFANGLTDTVTRVWWLQSRNFTIDLRLPKAGEIPVARAWADYSASELQVLANLEGWCAESHWHEQQLSWRGGVSLQWHNRWSEPALLRRVGNCMIEFAPSGSYVEDWRLQNSTGGPLVGLRLVDERDADSGQLLHRGGGLIICGDIAGWVCGRPHDAPGAGVNGFRAAVAGAYAQAQTLAQLFDFETSIATGSLDKGFEVCLSTLPDRLGKPLLDLSGFAFAADGTELVQNCLARGRRVERRFAVDTLEPNFAFTLASGAFVNRWYEQEAETLGRYTRVLV